MSLEFYETDQDQDIRRILEGLPLFEEIRPRTRNVLNDLLIILEVMVELLFSTGDRTKVTNILISNQNNLGYIYGIFDFNRQIWSPYNSQYSGFSSSSLSRRNQSQTIIFFAFEDLQFQNFSVIAKEKSIVRKIFDKICKLFGHQRTQGEQISQILNSQINDFYKAEKNFCTAAKGYRLICYRNNIRIKPRKIQSFLSTGFQASDLLKAPDSINVQRDFDYTRLRDLLEAGNWKEADQETTAILLKARGERVEGTNTNIAVTLVDDIFLGRVLHDIDALWVEYSNGHFGFSVQKRIWLEVGGEVDYNTECLLADAVGWRVQGKWLYYSDLTFSLNASKGHLPTTELSEHPLGWLYMGKRPLFKIPGTIRLARFIELPGCFIASKF
ncbi:GUN4 domain-containing protein [Scytonema tolypothrichoides VB-61278]|nr:GUN4 domain-containing protein [Scytonema tolypothrichoides VB-61278]